VTSDPVAYPLAFTSLNFTHTFPLPLSVADATRNAQVLHLLLVAISMTITAVRLFTPLTFQYGARKSARYKMAATR